MKIRGSLLAGLILAALLAAPLWAYMLFKVRIDGNDYCHMQFPAIDERTLGSDQPVLQNLDSGDLIDFYDPCDYDPRWKDEIAR